MRRFAISIAITTAAVLAAVGCGGTGAVPAVPSIARSAQAASVTAAQGSGARRRPQGHRAARGGAVHPPARHPRLHRPGAHPERRGLLRHPRLPGRTADGGQRNPSSLPRAADAGEPEPVQRAACAGATRAGRRQVGRVHARARPAEHAGPHGTVAVHARSRVRDVWHGDAGRRKGEPGLAASRTRLPRADRRGTQGVDAREPGQ